MTVPAMSERPTRHPLWGIVVSPVIWFLHFLACYVIVAVRCGKFPASSGSGLAVVLSALTVLAIIAIAASAIRNQSHARGHSGADHPEDSGAEARRFLGFTTVLLAMVSGVAVVFSAMTLAMLPGCR
jgi:hypothetical protein